MDGKWRGSQSTVPIMVCWVDGQLIEIVRETNELYDNVIELNGELNVSEPNNYKYIPFVYWCTGAWA